MTNNARSLFTRRQRKSIKLIIKKMMMLMMNLIAAMMGKVKTLMTVKVLKRR